MRRSVAESGGKGAHGANEERQSEREEEGETKNPPKKIDGVGEEAFWSGNRFGGALYVLNGNLIVRVSVGGPDNEETKIARSKAIGEKAVNALSR